MGCSALEIAVRQEDRVIPLPLHVHDAGADRPPSVTSDQLDRTADDIETELALIGEKEVSSLMIGERVMARLKGLDDVAYVRFASVYKSFRDIDEFMREVGSLVRARPEE